MRLHTGAQRLGLPSKDRASPLDTSPGLTTILSIKDGTIVPTIDPKANLVKYLGT